ncbi:hypothetical protein A2U01_0103941, partial [Trifolium medium]|nr:hypothetical protein [Trifolium medium]
VQGKKNQSPKPSPAPPIRKWPPEVLQIRGGTPDGSS